MLSRLSQYVVLALTVAVAVGYEVNLIATADAFFGSTAVLALVLGRALYRHDGEPLMKSAAGLFTRAEAHASPLAYWLFVATLAVSGLVTLRILVGY